MIKKAILSIILICLLIQLIPTSIADNKVIFRDDFDNKSSHWNWGTKYTAYQTISNGIAEFTIPIAFPNGQYDAEICDNGSAPYKYDNMKVKLRVDYILKGSRGWGFWDQKCNSNEGALAWFIYQKGSLFYPMNGLWIMCMNDGIKGGITIKPIWGYDIREWHEYEINWTKNSVDFFIDGKNVAHVTKNVPQVNCKADIWIDNAVYRPNHRCFTLLHRETLYLDYIEITE